jgi:hypothetical protein
MTSTLRDEIAALRQWLKENGLVIVPREATEKMWIAGADKYAQIGSNNLLVGDFESIWTAMLSAAPDPLEPDKHS